MNNKQLQLLFCAIGVITSSIAYSKDTIAPAPNGIKVPVGYQNWRVIGTSHRTDNNSLRVIVGNTIAVNAARNGHFKPWPTGTILGKLVWQDSQHPAWDKATVPGELSHIEFMVKDPVNFAATGGWGYARWKGMDAVPYGSDANFANECYSCHTKVKNNDYVFTEPVQLP